MRRDCTVGGEDINKGSSILHGAAAAGFEFRLSLFPCLLWRPKKVTI